MGSSQSSCVFEKRGADLSAQWIGAPNPLDGVHDRLGADPTRRADRTPQMYGSGIPSMNSSTLDKFGVARGAHNSTEFHTPGGTLKLPLQERETSRSFPIEFILHNSHIANAHLPTARVKYF